MSDARVSERFEVSDGKGNAERIVIDDRGYTVGIGGSVDQNQRQSFGDAFGDDGVIPSRGCQDQSIDLAGAHSCDGFRFPRCDIVCVPENGRVAVCPQPVLDPTDDRREQRVGDIGNQHADGLRAVCPQAARRLVRAVSEFRGGLIYLGDDLGCDPAPRGGIKHARYRRRVYPDALGDISDRYPAAARQFRLPERSLWVAGRAFTCHPRGAGVKVRGSCANDCT